MTVSQSLIRGTTRQRIAAAALIGVLVVGDVVWDGKDCDGPKRPRKRVAVDVVQVHIPTHHHNTRGT